VKTDGIKEKPIFGMDADPNNSINVTTDSEGQPTVKINGSPADRMDMVDAMEERFERKLKGKNPDRLPLFRGVDFDECGKIIR
jgi:hypothetical protein